MLSKYKKILLQWYIDNGIDDVFSSFPYNHFNSIKKSQEVQTLNKQDIINNESKKNIQVSKIKTSLYKPVVQKNETKYELKYIYNNPEEWKKKSIENTLNIDVENIIKNARDSANSSFTIEELKSKIENFEYFSSYKKDSNMVFCDGNIESKIMIIDTTTPKIEESNLKKSLQEDSGELFNNMLKSINLTRNDVYITNIFFWRPAGGRNLNQTEIEIAKPFVEKHIALFNPKIIVFLGTNAINNYIKTDSTITNSRQKLFKYENQYINGKTIKSILFFHPKYIIESQNKKKELWNDLLFFKKNLE